VKIVIEVNTWEPPEGVISMGAGSGPEAEPVAIAFDGWLGLVGKLHEVFGSSAGGVEGDAQLG
jgi:hypothetical protein